MTGTQPQFQEIYLVKSKTERVVMAPNAIQLRDFEPEPGMTIDVTDRNPHSMLANGGMNDLTKVIKFELTDAEYDTREGTVRAFLR